MILHSGSCRCQNGAVPKGAPAKKKPAPVSAVRPYHHGSLRSVILRAAVAHIAEYGPASLSLRELARRAGVSHAAPAHHFGNKTGVFTAIATEGFRMVAEATSAIEGPSAMGAAGLAYLRFAVDHPAHFMIMSRPDLYDGDDPELIAARSASEAGFLEGVSELSPDDQTGPAIALAARCAMHGFVSLWLGHALTEYGSDVEEVAMIMGVGLMELGVAAQRQREANPQLTDPDAWS